MESNGLSRGEFLRRSALAGGVVLGSGGLLAACGGGEATTTSAAPAAGTTEAAGGATTEAAAAEPKKGGVLRVGLGGGGSNDQLDVAKATNQADFARSPMLYEGLFEFDADMKLKPRLAESAETNEIGDEWTVRLREGLEFHNGKTVTVDDLIFSIQRNFDPKLGYSYFLVPLSKLGLDLKNGVTKMDERTVRFKLKKPFSVFDQWMALNMVIPTDYDPKNPVGTGAFKFNSFTPGQQSVMDAFENYWDVGPYVDQLIMLDITDDAARVNALLSNQVDAITALPYGQIPVVENTSGLKVLNAETGTWRPFTMRVDVAPWSDNRVRQAMRLIVDRQQMVDQVLAGNGRVANDLYSPYDPCFASEIPQREQDIEQAKSLLKQAGHENMTAEMTASPVNGGTVEMAEVFVQQAKAAGVTVKLTKVDPGTFYGDQYLKWPFAIDFWGTTAYLNQVAQADGPGATWSETHFADPEFGKLFDEALGTVDEAKRCDIIHQMQAIQHDRGGYIIHYYVNVVDGYSDKLLGMKPWKTGDDLNGYHLNEVSFA